MKIVPGQKPSFITRVDVIVLGCILTLLVGIGVVVRYVLQKETVVTVEMLAAGGKWWWGVPPPYYWNAREIEVGSKEFDAQKVPIVEIVDLVKYGEDDRKFMWMKVKLRAKQNMLNGQYVFRQESLQIGKTVHIAPNNIALTGQIIGIEGVSSVWDPEYVTVEGKVWGLQPWEADVIKAGDEIRDNKGELIARITKVDVVLADILTTNFQGEPLARKNPLTRDVTLTIHMRVMKDGNMRYFNFYQPVAVGYKTRIQFPKTSVEIHVMSVKTAPSSEDFSK